MADSATAHVLAFAGTYTKAQPAGEDPADGIYSYRFDPASGALTLLCATGGIANPSFLSMDAQGRYLYAVSEVADHESKRSGSVTAYAIDRQTGALRFLNRQPSHGAGPCYVTVDPASQFVLVANYSGGSVAMYPLQDGGSLGEASDVHQFAGTSVNPERQDRAHAHSIVVDPAGKYVFVPDLGTDKVMQFRLDRAQGKLLPHAEPFLAVEPGAGPRHFAFHPRARHGYVINELGCTITACTYDADQGRLAAIQTVSTLPAGFTGTSYCADIHVTDSGRFLYGSNRGHDSIVIFRIDPQSGRLSLVGHEPTGGQTPRNFALDPSARFLLAANQDSDTIVSFRINPETGKLTPTGQITSVPRPVCIKMLAVES